MHANEITHGMNTSASPSLILAPSNTIESQTLLLSGVVLVFRLLNALRIQLAYHQWKECLHYHWILKEGTGRVL